MSKKEKIYLGIAKIVSLLFLIILFILVLYFNQYLPIPYISEKFFVIFGKANCLPDKCFCETIHYNSIAQPMNSLSNIFYLYVGIWILFSQKQWSYFSIMYAYIVILLGLGSFFYHATLTFLGQWWDVF